jgi:hypothetical protein
MTYTAKEQSSYDSNPVEIYRFTYGATSYFYTSSIFSIVYDGDTYLPEPIERGSITIARELSKNPFSITVSHTNPIAALFLNGIPVRPVVVEIFRTHRTDFDEEFIALTACRVVHGEYSGPGKVRLTAQQDSLRMSQSGLNRSYGTRCQKIVYSDACGATRNDIAGTVVSADAYTITIDEAGDFPDQTFRSGLLAWNGDDYMITGHIGTDITINAAINPAIDDPVTLTVGCLHNIDDCDETHNNKLNYGGQPFIPDKEIFVGKAVKK